MSICGIMDGKEFRFEGGEEFVLRYGILVGPVTVQVQAIATAGRYIFMKAESGQMFSVPWGDLGTHRATRVLDRSGEVER